MAFIRENQASVLRDSIASLEASSLDDLPRTVHAIHGSLGSYQLHSRTSTSQPSRRCSPTRPPRPSSASLAQRETVVALRAELATLQAGSEQPA